MLILLEMILVIILYYELHKEIGLKRLIEEGFFSLGIKARMEELVEGLILSLLLVQLSILIKSSFMMNQHIM